MTTDKGSRVAVYIRISTTDQSTALQTDELPAYCKARGWEIVETYIDRGVSGTKDRRPALDRLMADAKRKRFDAVVCWRFDRFARSTSHLLRALEEFSALGIDFVSLKESIDTSTPVGRMVFTILASVTELERNIMRERCTAGRKAARRRGVRFGRPTADVDVKQVQKLRAAGLSWREVAGKMQMPKDTLIRATQRA